MALTRRELLRQVAYLGAANLLPHKVFASSERGLLMASASSVNEAHGLSYGWLSESTIKGIQRLALPERAHEVIAHPYQPWLIVVSRRPGRFIHIVDYLAGRVIKVLQSGEGRHLYGHALLSPDGRFLIVPENDIASGQGRIVVREIGGNFALLQDMPSYGIGPHQIGFLPTAEKTTLVIANGGIETHPDTQRSKLNLDTMQSSLDYVDLSSGQHLDRQRLDVEWFQCSLRHFDINAVGEVIVAMQYQGASTDDVPLLAVHRPGQKIQPLWGDRETRFAMKQYCGSVKWNSQGKLAAVSSPPGSLISVWDVAQGRLHSRYRLTDGCGIAAIPGEADFLLSGGTGLLQQLDVHKRALKNLPYGALSVQWDNHLLLGV